MNRLVRAAPWALLLAIGMAATEGATFAPVADLHVASIGHGSVSMHRRNPQAWRQVVIAANVALNQSIASKLLSQTRVRLSFVNGAWIEFQPDRDSITTNSLPPILAIQFARAGDS